MTATSVRTDALAPAEFRVGRVFSRAFGILTRNFVKFFLLTVIATVPSLLLIAAGAYSVVAGGPKGTPNFSGTAIAMAGGGALLWLILYMLSQAVVLYGAFQDMRGRPFSIGTSLKWGLARLPAIIGLSICLGIAVIVGFMLLVVPGFIVLSMLFVSLPACVVERVGPFESMGRSATLTKGHRWRVFGIYLLLMLIMTVVGGVIQFAGAAIGGIVSAIVSFAWNAVAGALQAVVAVVVYHDLRVVKEGVDVDQIAAVFD